MYEEQFYRYTFGLRYVMLNDHYAIPAISFNSVKYHLTCTENFSVISATVLVMHVYPLTVQTPLLGSLANVTPRTTDNTIYLPFRCLHVGNVLVSELQSRGGNRFCQSGVDVGISISVILSI